MKKTASIRHIDFRRNAGVGASFEERIELLPAERVVNIETLVHQSGDSIVRIWIAVEWETKDGIVQ